MIQSVPIKYIVTGIIILVTILLTAMWYGNRSTADQVPPVLYEIADFSFQDAHGNTFGKQQLLGKITVVDFMFTSCLGPCPVMSTKMKYIYEQFRQFDKLQLVSISVDPENDSPEKLRNYAESFGVMDDRWRFIRNDSISEVADLCENSFKLAADDLPAGHPVYLILLDDQGMIRGYYDALDNERMELLLSHIEQLRI